jgi:N-acetylglutamate synthase-like GNAT family acetyltransferase
MTRIRVAQQDDLPRLLEFYRQTGYSGGVTPTDRILLAEVSGSTAAAVRLCKENGTLVLRGMRVREDLRRRGIGTSILKAALPIFGEEGCYCIAHPYLETFHGQFGFAKLGLDQAPEFLLDRLRNCRARGLDVILMGREGGAASG